MYLEHSVRAPVPPACEIQDGECEEEDLSMVSDASSGPPQLQSEDVPTQNYRGGEENDPAAAKGSHLYTSSKRRRVQNSEHNPYSSDDTASSRLVSKGNVSPGDGQSMENFLDFSQGFSTTSFKKQPAFQKGFGPMKSPTPGNAISAEGSKGKRWP
ncbi:unnamed protein product [Victoria cruziana]